MTASLRAAVLALAAASLAAALACTGADPGAVSRAASSTPTGSLSSARSQLTLTALPDGRAIAAGGYGPIPGYVPGAVGIAEAWDPGTGAFGGVVSLATPRLGAVAVHLGAGTDLLLVAGGMAGDGVSGFAATAAADLYTAHWAMPVSGGAVPSMLWPRSQHAGVALGDGRALVCGGGGATNATLSSCEIFDPATHAWTTVASMTQPRRRFTLTLLDGGKVLAAGGAQDGGALAPGAEVYDPAANTWTAIAGAQVGRYAHRAFKLQDGRVILVGGSAGTYSMMASVLIYQPKWNLVGEIGPLSVGRYDCEGAVLPDGRVLVAGGHGSTGRATSSVEVLSPSSLGWTSLAPMVEEREQFGLALVADGKLLAAGGSNYGSAYVSSAELIDPTCVPTTCGAGACGAVPDGCGGTLSCGTCGGGQVCSTAHQCCTPTTCAAAGAACGAVADGCGGTLSCGTCGGGQVCSTAHQCCTPWTCTAGACGTFSDGCGNLVSCSCSGGQVCDGGTGTCCTPTTCAAAGKTCGTISNGCGGTLSCGTCAAGQTCTGGACVGDPTVATWDATLAAPRCTTAGPSCDSGTLLVGRAGVGPEAHAPNTVATAVCSEGTSGTFHSDESLDRLRIASVDGGPLTAGRQARVEATVWAYSGYSSDHLDLYLSPSAAAPAWTLLATLTPTRAGAQTLSAVVTLPAGATQVLRGGFRYGGSAAPCTSGSYDDHDDLVFAVVSPRDVTAPTAAITSPAANATVSGVVPVAVAATDDVGVTRVELWDGAVLVAATTSAPATFSWDVSAATTGVHTLTARALDAAGNAGTSPAVAVLVSRAAPAYPVLASYDPGRKVPACMVLGAAGCDTGALVNGRGAKGPEANAPNTLGGSCADGTSGAYHSDESLDRLRIVTRSGAPLAPGQAVRVEATVWAWGTADRLDVWYAADASAPAWTLAGTVAPASSGAQTLSVDYVLPAGTIQAIRGTFRYGGGVNPCTTGGYDDHDDLVFVTQ